MALRARVRAHIRVRVRVRVGVGVGVGARVGFRSGLRSGLGLGSDYAAEHLAPRRTPHTAHRSPHHRTGLLRRANPNSKPSPHRTGLTLHRHTARHTARASLDGRLKSPPPRLMPRATNKWSRKLASAQFSRGGGQQLAAPRPTASPHATRHTPHATRHASRATRHASRATRHAPHATRFR